MRAKGSGWVKDRVALNFRVKTQREREGERENNNKKASKGRPTNEHFWHLSCSKICRVKVRFVLHYSHVYIELIKLAQDLKLCAVSEACPLNLKPI